MASWRFSAVACCVLASSALSQATWAVPTGADLAPYIAQAAAGDVLQLGASHPAFSLDKGLVLLGAPGGTVVGSGGFMPPPLLDSSVDVPAGQRARLAGLRFLGWTHSSGLYAPWGGRVTVQGNVSFEDCRFELSDSQTGIVRGALDVLGGEVVLTRCHLQSRTHHVALRLVAGLCSITDSTLFGPSQQVTPQSGWSANANRAVVQLGGVLVGTRLDVRGGHNNCPLCYGLAAGGMQLVAGTTFLSDSTVTGGTGSVQTPSFASPAIDAHPGVYLARNLLQSCSPNPPPTPAPGAVDMPELLGLSAAIRPQIGQVFQATAFVGAANALVACFGAFDLAALPVPLFAEPVWLDAGSLVLVGLQVTTAAGGVPFSVTVPNQPILLGAPIWLQAMQDDGGDSGLHLSPVVGGTIR